MRSHELAEGDEEQEAGSSSSTQHNPSPSAGSPPRQQPEAAGPANSALEEVSKRQEQPPSATRYNPQTFWQHRSSAPVLPSTTSAPPGDAHVHQRPTTTAAASGGKPTSRERLEYFGEGIKKRTVAVYNMARTELPQWVGQQVGGMSTTSSVLDSSEDPANCLLLAVQRKLFENYHIAAYCLIITAYFIAFCEYLYLRLYSLIFPERVVYRRSCEKHPNDSLSIVRNEFHYASAGVVFVVIAAFQLVCFFLLTISGKWLEMKRTFTNVITMEERLHNELAFAIKRVMFLTAVPTFVVYFLCSVVITCDIFYMVGVRDPVQHLGSQIIIYAFDLFVLIYFVTFPLITLLYHPDIGCGGGPADAADALNKRSGRGKRLQKNERHATATTTTTPSSAEAGLRPSRQAAWAAPDQHQYSSGGVRRKRRSRSGASEETEHPKRRRRARSSPVLLPSRGGDLASSQHPSLPMPAQAEDDIQSSKASAHPRNGSFHCREGSRQQSTAKTTDEQPSFISTSIPSFVETRLHTPAEPTDAAGQSQLCEAQLPTTTRAPASAEPEQQGQQQQRYCALSEEYAGKQFSHAPTNIAHDHSQPECCGYRGSNGAKAADNHGGAGNSSSIGKQPGGNKWASGREWREDDTVVTTNNNGRVEGRMKAEDRVAVSGQEEQAEAKLEGAAVGRRGEISAAQPAKEGGRRMEGETKKEKRRGNKKSKIDKRQVIKVDRYRRLSDAAVSDAPAGQSPPATIM